MAAKFGNFWDLKDTIFVDPNTPNNKTNDLMASGILMEVLNASRTKDFDNITAKAKAGDLSRIDFAVANEKIEFDNVKKHHVIAEAAVKAGV